MCQIVDYGCCNHHTCGRRNERGGAGKASASGRSLLPLRGIAAGVLAGAVRLQRTNGRLSGINHLQLPDAASLQFSSHDSGKGILRGAEKIRYGELRGIRAVAAAHGRDDRDVGFLRLQDNLDLGSHRINGIHNIVKLSEVKLSRILREKKGRPGVDRNFRIEICNALARGIHLVSSDRTACGKNLAVQIGEADPVIVNEIQGADSHAGQSLHRASADASDAEDGNTAIAKKLHIVRTVEQF